MLDLMLGLSLAIMSYGVGLLIQTYSKINVNIIKECRDLIPRSHDIMKTNMFIFAKTPIAEIIYCYLQYSFTSSACKMDVIKA